MAGKAGGNSRKIGRAKRSPSAARYTAENRAEKNARKRQARHQRAVTKKAAKLTARVQRGLPPTRCQRRHMSMAVAA